MSKSIIYTPEQAQFVLTNITSMTIEEIQSHLGKTRQSVLTFLRHKRIPIHEYVHLQNVKADQFINVTSKEVAYLLGYIWADGYVDKIKHAITLQCGKADLEELKWIFDKTGKWVMKHYERLPNISTYKTYNQVIANHLKAHGYIVKSLENSDKILSTIPDHLKHYWWRGYFDGDGWISVGLKTVNCCISGHVNQDWKSLIDLMESLGIPYKHRTCLQDRGDASQVSAQGGSKGAMRFLDYLYQGYDEDHIGLKRKYDRYLEGKRLLDNARVGASGYRGVKKSLEGPGYTAVMQIDGQNTFLGSTFPTAEAAAVAYDLMAVKTWGWRAQTNIPIEAYSSIIREEG